MSKRVIAAALAAALAGGLAPTADAAFVSKKQARDYVLRVVPRGAPRVMLGDERAAFFRTARISAQPARDCRRHEAAAVSCRFSARLVPDAAHRRLNWWPIDCRGVVLVRRLRDNTLQGVQRNYVCRTVRP